MLPNVMLLPRLGSTVWMLMSSPWADLFAFGECRGGRPGPTLLDPVVRNSRRVLEVDGGGPPLTLLEVEMLVPAESCLTGRLLADSCLVTR